MGFDNVIITCFSVAKHSDVNTGHQRVDGYRCFVISSVPFAKIGSHWAMSQRYSSDAAMIDKKDATCCYTSGFPDWWYLLEHDVIHVCAYFKGHVASHLIWSIEKKKWVKILRRLVSTRRLILWEWTKTLLYFEIWLSIYNDSLLAGWPVAKLAHDNIVSISISQFNILSMH